MDKPRHGGARAGAGKRKPIKPVRQIRNLSELGSKRLYWLQRYWGCNNATEAVEKALTLVHEQIYGTPSPLIEEESGE